MISFIDMEPRIIEPFDPETFEDLRTHVTEVRRLFDYPGVPYHDDGQPDDNRFNRWCWHNPPVLRELHHRPAFIMLASDIFGEYVKPSYVFLSMYGPNGVCPPHTDRPQCKYTIDLQIRSDGHWPIYVADQPYYLENAQALAYSGTDQKHYRWSMTSAPTIAPTNFKLANFMDLAFFHFVPVKFMGRTE